MIIHATRKLAARLPAVSPNLLPEDSLLGGWHADRLTIDRVQRVLFCHDVSRAVLFLPRVRKPQFAELGSRWFLMLLTGTLATLGCPDAQIARRRGRSPAQTAHRECWLARGRRSTGPMRLRLRRRTASPALR